MDQRSFKEKRSPSKNSGTPKQRFKAPSFANEEKHPASPLAQSLSLAQSQHDASASGKLRIPRSTERSHSRKSESSVAGVSVFQDEDPLFSNPKGGAISQKETAHGHSAGNTNNAKSIEYDFYGGPIYSILIQFCTWYLHFSLIRRDTSTT